MEVSLLAKKKKKDSLVLVHITGHVSESEAQSVAEFTKALMDAAYLGECLHTDYVSSPSNSSLQA